MLNFYHSYYQKFKWVIAATQFSQPRIVPELGKAFQVANEANLGLKEFDDMEAQEMAIKEQRGIITRGVEEGLERPLERARIQLMQAGRQEGIQAGIKLVKEH